MLWPLAALEVIRGAPTASAWSAIHARQALVYGVFATIGFIALLVVPFTIAFAPALGTGGTIVVYEIALPLDVLYVIVAIAIAVRCAARSQRGELFALPIVSPIADAVFGRR